MSVKIDTGSALSHLSMTPMIDIVFLLLIFFLVASRFEEEERAMDVTVPAASEAGPLTDQSGDTYVTIDKQGRYFVTGQFVTLKKLEEILVQVRADNPHSAKVVIRADEDAKHRYVVAAMNACNKAKIFRYQVTTQKHQGKGKG